MLERHSPADEETGNLVIVKEILRRNESLLREKFGVKRIGVFGSWARGEATPDSDVDILVEFSRPIGWEFIDLKELLARLLGRDVDLVTPAALKPQLRDTILAEVSYA